MPTTTDKNAISCYCDGEHYLFSYTAEHSSHNKTAAPTTSSNP
jgi:hypothetical protein